MGQALWEKGQASQHARDSHCDITSGLRTGWDQRGRWARLLTTFPNAQILQ